MFVFLYIMLFIAVESLWLFGPVVCDVFNANDVLFSTELQPR